MEEHPLQPDRRRNWPIAVLFAAIPVLAAAAVWCLLFGYNQFALEIERIGAETIDVEYGTAFVDPGCRIRLRGNRLFRDGIEIHAAAEVSGSVQEQTVGRYPLEYHAAFLGYQASAQRIVRIVDTQPPVIELRQDPDPMPAGVAYRESGFFAFDNYDGDLTDRVERTEIPGKVMYSVMDSSGNLAYAEREIPFVDLTPPAIDLTGGTEYTIECGLPYSDPGFSAVDDWDGDLTPMVQVYCEQEILRYTLGDYRVHYVVSDSSGNIAETERIVHVVPSQRPVIQQPKGRIIYLTFDDGPGPDTPRLLDLLKRYQVQATFFVVDTGYPDLLRRIVAEGHSIGVHTRSHNYREIYSSIDAYFSDLFAMQQIILDATGVETWLMRFPGGSSNTISRFQPGIMTELTQAVEQCGFSYFDWNVDSRDAGGAQKTSEVIRNIKDGVSNNRVSVVLQHDIHSFSVDAVESILIWGLNNGYTFLPLQIDSPAVHHAVGN